MILNFLYLIAVSVAIKLISWALEDFRKTCQRRKFLKGFEAERLRRIQASKPTVPPKQLEIPEPIIREWTGCSFTQTETSYNFKCNIDERYY